MERKVLDRAAPSGAGRRTAALVVAAAVGAAGVMQGAAAETAGACAYTGAHDIKTVSKVTVKRTYTLPRDNKRWQYRVVQSHRRVYGCGYAGGQGGKGVYLGKGQRLYVMKNPSGGPSATVSAGFGYGGASCSVSVKIPLGKQGAKSSTMAATYNKAKKKGYYKAYSHVVYDVYTTCTFRRIWSKKKKRYTKWTKCSKGITEKRAYAFKYQLIRQ